MPRHKRKRSLIAANIPPWRWWKIYFDPKTNQTIKAHLYLIETLPSKLLYELRYIPQDASIETVIAKIKAGTTSSVFVQAYKIAKTQQLSPYFDDNGYKSQWKQEPYDQLTLPEPIMPPTKTSRKKLNKKVMMKEIAYYAKQNLIRKHITQKQYDEIVEWANNIEIEQLEQAYLELKKQDL